MGKACWFIGNDAPGNMTVLEFFKKVIYSRKKASLDTDIFGIGVEKLLPVRAGARLFGV